MKSRDLRTVIWLSACILWIVTGQPLSWQLLVIAAALLLMAAHTERTKRR